MFTIKLLIKLHSCYLIVQNYTRYDMNITINCNCCQYINNTFVLLVKNYVLQVLIREKRGQKEMTLLSVERQEVLLLLMLLLLLLLLLSLAYVCLAELINIWDRFYSKYLRQEMRNNDTTYFIFFCEVFKFLTTGADTINISGLLV